MACLHAALQYGSWSSGAATLTHGLPQIGRAGRDGLPSKCLMLWSGQDWSKLDFIKVRTCSLLACYL